MSLFLIASAAGVALLGKSAGVRAAVGGRAVSSLRFAAPSMAEGGLRVAWTPSSRGGLGLTPRDVAHGALGDTAKYCEELGVVTRRKTCTVTAGPVKFGSDHPLVRQTMATTLTSDVEASVKQIMACADEGFDLVRVTVVGMKDAKACVAIRASLDAKGYDIPLCADMHFAPKVTTPGCIDIDIEIQRYLCICIHTYTYPYTLPYVCVCLYIYTYTHTHICTRTYTFMYVYIHTHSHTHTHTHTHFECSLLQLP